MRAPSIDDLLSLRLYLDDCVDNARLFTLLQENGHHVPRPRDVSLTGASDITHFTYAHEHDLILITANPRDFESLHEQYPDHPGIFAIYQDNDPRDMTLAEIVQAIQNVMAAGVPIAGQFVTLNSWRY